MSRRKHTASALRRVRELAMENLPEATKETQVEEDSELEPPIKKHATSPSHNMQHTDSDHDTPAPDPERSSTDLYGAPHPESVSNDPGEVPGDISELQERPYLPAVS